MVAQAAKADKSGGLIYDLIPKIMQIVGAVEKTRKSDTQNYRFRGIDDLYFALQGPMAENGVCVVPSVLDAPIREERKTRDGKGTLIYTTLRVKHTFFAPDGSFVEAVTIGVAMDSGDKSSNKAMSAAMKYALIEVFAIPTEGDNDTENNSPQPAARQQPAQRPAANGQGGKVAPDISDERRMLHDLFVERGFKPAEQKSAVAAALQGFKLTKLEELSSENWATLLGHVAEGKADRFAKNPTKPAEKKKEEAANA